MMNSEQKAKLSAGKGAAAKKAMKKYPNLAKLGKKKGKRGKKK